MLQLSMFNWLKSSQYNIFFPDCNHDMYNGVFPVEKILRWRKTKVGHVKENE